MTTIVDFAGLEARADQLSETVTAGFVDRWIYVYMAASFVVVTLVAFIPDSLDKIAAVQSGARPPFPLVLHLHAVLMASFLALLLAQTTLAAVGRIDLHMRLGLLSVAIVPALVVVGFILVPTMYREAYAAFQEAAPAARAHFHAVVERKDNIALLQIRMGLLFTILLALGLRLRRRDAGFHKRMMILAAAAILPPSINRLEWLPTTYPRSMIPTEIYMLAMIAPMFILDVVRNHAIHRAYWVWLGISLPFVVTMHALWNTPWWHATAQRMMVG